MTGPQIDAFTRSTGGVSPEQLLTVIAGIMAVIYLTWLAWISYSQLRTWKKGQGDFYDVMFIMLQASVIAMLIGFYIR